MIILEGSSGVLYSLEKLLSSLVVNWPAVVFLMLDSLFF